MDQSPTCQRLNRRVHVEMVRLETEQAVAPSTTTIGDEANLAQTSTSHPGCQHRTISQARKSFQRQRTNRDVTAPCEEPLPEFGGGSLDLD